MKRQLAGVLIALAALACGRDGTAPGQGGDLSLPEAPPAGPPAPGRDGLVNAGYADPSSCAPCHADIAESYRQVAMARSFSRPDPSDLIEDYARHNRLEHRSSGLEYEMRRDGKHFFQRRFPIAGGGPEAALEKEVTYVIGSGRHARSYLHLDASGEMIEMPVTWYSQEGAWGMSPGYDRPDQADFFRPVTYTCLFCHNAYPSLPAASDSPLLPQLFPADLPSGIDCQRCHGPGERHIRLARSRSASFAEVRAAVVNPARLPRERQMDVCMQCHLETTSSANWSGLVAFGRGVFSFRPGEDLAAYRIHFDRPRGTGYDDAFEIAHQAYRLRQSACFLKSGRMTCTTCHDPHRRPVEKAAFFASKCLGCHALGDCAPATRLAAGGGRRVDCIPCHMPSRRTEDVVHVVMTDHLIRRSQPPAAQRLAMRPERTDRYTGPIRFYRPEEIPQGDWKDLVLGVASLQDDVDRPTGLALLEKSVRALDPALPEPHFQLGLTLLSAGRIRESTGALRRAAALAPRSPRILLALGTALEADGRDEEALDIYARALAVQPAASAAHTNSGRILARRGRVKDALAHFEAAIRSGDALALGNRGTVFASLGRAAEAEQDLREALRIRPGLAEAALQLATVLVNRDDPAAALSVLEDGARRNPANAVLMTRLAWILATSPSAGVRNGSRAIEWATRAVSQSERRDPRALDALAAGLAEAGRALEASRVAAEAGGAAKAAGQKDLADAIEKRRRLYLGGLAYRDRSGGTEIRKPDGAD